MRIKITKELTDVQKFIRPFVNDVFEVKRIIEARYNPTQNNIKVIEVKGHEVSVLNNECEVMQRKEMNNVRYRKI